MTFLLKHILPGLDIHLSNEEAKARWTVYLSLPKLC